MNKLLKDYGSHLQIFIDKMVKNPIKINNYKILNMTTRQELMANSSNKILDKKGFSFKSFKTDKDRIKAYTQKKEMTSITNNNNDNNTKKNNKKKINLKKYFLNTENNKEYKADIKKIINYFNHKGVLNNEEKLYYEQLKNFSGINLYDIQIDEDDKFIENKINNRLYTSKDNLNIINNDTISNEIKYKKLMHNKIYNHTKKMLFLRKLKLKYSNKLKKIKTNSNIFSKTHFKALENITLFKSPTINHKINKTLSLNEVNSDKNIKNVSPQSKKKLYCNTENNPIEAFINDNNYGKLSIFESIKNYNNKKISKIFTPKIFLDDLSLTKEVANINPLLFKYNINAVKNFLNKNNKNTYLKDKILALKKIAFEKKKTNEVLYEEKYENDYFDIEKKNEELMNNEEKFNILNSDKLADKLLKKCNLRSEINIKK